MKREDHEERLRILSMRLRDAECARDSLALMNTAHLTAKERADLDAKYALAVADLIRAERELANAIVAASE